MDNLDLYAAFKAHTAGHMHFTRRMAINIADFFGTTPRFIIQHLERLWILKEGSWDWFTANGGITRDHIEQARHDRAIDCHNCKGSGIEFVYAGNGNVLELPCSECAATARKEEGGE